MSERQLEHNVNYVCDASAVRSTEAFFLCACVPVAPRTLKTRHPPKHTTLLLCMRLYCWYWAVPTAKMLSDKAQRAENHMG